VEAGWGREGLGLGLFWGGGCGEGRRAEGRLAAGGHRCWDVEWNLRLSSLCSQKQSRMFLWMLAGCIRRIDGVDNLRRK
jgi:hypothetical protein